MFATQTGEEGAADVTADGFVRVFGGLPQIGEFGFREVHKDTFIPDFLRILAREATPIFLAGLLLSGSFLLRHSDIK